MKDQMNLILVLLITYLVYVGYTTYFSEEEELVNTPMIEQTEAVSSAPVEVAIIEEGVDLPKVSFANQKISGAIHLRGGFISDVSLHDYSNELDGAEPYSLLRSHKGRLNNFAGASWLSSNPNLVLPDANTVWQADREELAVGQTLTLSWSSNQGIIFKIIYSLDENYLLSVKQQVVNNSKQIVNIYPYSYLERRSLPDDLTDSWMVHQGINGYLKGKITEVDYDDLDEAEENFNSNDGGWIAFADRYWLTALIFPTDYLVKAKAANNGTGYRIAFTSQAEQTLLPGATNQASYDLYLGVKDRQVLASYEKNRGIASFEDAIDWGWLYFLTKPVAWLLDSVRSYVGNYGLAIILLTAMIKLVAYPLTRSSTQMTVRMRDLKPELKIINERFKDDKDRQRLEMMSLYKKYGVNPLKMVVPFLIQIPLFISFYKVLTISINLRHAPFFAWIQDLSIPDPTNLLTGFGYLPIEWPFGLQVSVLSLFAGFMLWLQFKYGSSGAAEGSAAMIMKVMPVFLIFVFARIPAAVLLYICTSSSLTGLEQIVAKYSTKK